MNLDKEKLERNQAKNDQAEKDLDQELNEALEDEGEFIEPSDEEPEKKEPIKSEDINDDEEEEEIVDDEEDHGGKEEEKEKEDEKEKQPPKEDKKPSEKIERPQKYIPLSKYQEEKGKWKETKEELDKANEKIAELSEIKDKDQTKSEEDEDIKKLAEKWDTPVDFVKDLMSTLKKGNKIDTKVITDQEKEKAEEKPTNKPVEKTQEEIVAQFDSEFNDFVGELKKEYPDATEEQIQEAKKAMDEYAHSPGYNNYPLGHIMKINSKDFDLILKGTPNKPGVEGGRAGGAGPTDFSTKAFMKGKDGNYDFSELHKLPEGSKKEKIVDGLPLEAWDAYVQELDTMSELQVSKNDGRIVSLK